MSKISSQDQMLHDVPVTQMIEQWREGPELVCQDRSQRRTVEQIADVPIFKVFTEVPKISSQEGVEAAKMVPHVRINKRMCEQITTAICDEVTQKLDALFNQEQTPRKSLTTTCGEVNLRRGSGGEVAA